MKCLLLVPFIIGLACLAILTLVFSPHSSIIFAPEPEPTPTPSPSPSPTPSLISTTLAPEPTTEPTTIPPPETVTTSLWTNLLVGNYTKLDGADDWARAKRHSPANHFDVLGFSEFPTPNSRQRSFNNTSGKILFPVTFNAANLSRIEASSTCGFDIDHDEMYCQLVGGYSVFKADMIVEGQPCDLCLAGHPNKSHRAENVLESGTDKWWMSPPLSRGLHYKEVNLTLSFGQPFEIPYIYMTMANSPRPDVWILEKSLDYGKHWEPWQYFTTSLDNCQEYFPSIPTQIERDNSVICTQEHSAIFPLECGEIPISLTKGRPSMKNNEISSELLQFITATNIRIRFIKPKTVSGVTLAMEPRPGITRRIFYSLSSIDIAARCICNGHAYRCLEDFATVLQQQVGVSSTRNRPDQVEVLVQQVRQLKCHCEHNTEGDQCQRCRPPYVQKRWRPAYEMGPPTAASAAPGPNQRGAWVSSTFECEPCQCHNHTDRCEYNATVDRLHLSLDTHGRMEGGGVCLDCQHHTTGINCDKCIEGYYHPRDRSWSHNEACIPCDCDPSYTTGKCDINGHCECLPGLLERKLCAGCKPRYYGDNLKRTCRPCQCDWRGASGCDQTTGQCLCHPNVEGAQCERCTRAHFGLELALQGCRPCKCGVGARSPDCHQMTGQCDCRAGLTGRQCEQCQYDQFGYEPTTGQCHQCQCHEQLSHVGEIEARNRAKMASEATSGGGRAFIAMERLCDQYTGQCPCKKNVVGLNCDQCRHRYVVNGTSGCRQCDECTEPLFSKLDLVATTIDDTFAYANHSKSYNQGLAKMAKWNDDATTYKQFFYAARDQLGARIRDYALGMNMTQIEWTIKDSDRDVTIIMRHYLDEMETLVGQLRHWDRHLVADQLGLLHGAQRSLANRLAGFSRTSQGAQLLERSLAELVERHRVFESDLEEQVLQVDAHLDCTLCHQREAVLTDNKIAQLQWRMNETIRVRSTELQDYASGHSKLLATISELNEDRNISLSLVANLTQLEETLIPTYRRLFSDIQEADSQLNQGLITCRAYTEKHIRPRYEISGTNGAQVAGFGALEAGQARFQASLKAYRDYMERVERVNNVSLAVITRGKLVELFHDMVNTKTSIGYVLANNIKMYHNILLPEKMKTLDGLRRQVILMSDSAMNESRQMKSLLESMDQVDYLRQTGQVVMKSASALYELSVNFPVDQLVANIDQLAARLQGLQENNDNNVGIHAKTDHQVALTDQKSVHMYGANLKRHQQALEEVEPELMRRQAQHQQFVARLRRAVEEPNNNVTERLMPLSRRVSNLRIRAENRALEQQDWMGAIQETATRARLAREIVKGAHPIVNTMQEHTQIKLNEMRNCQLNFYRRTSSNSNSNSSSNNNDIENKASHCLLDGTIRDAASRLAKLEERLSESRGLLNKVKIGAYFSGQHCVRLRWPAIENASSFFAASNADLHTNTHTHTQTDTNNDKRRLALSMMVKTRQKEGTLFYLATAKLRPSTTTRPLAAPETETGTFTDFISASVHQGQLRIQARCEGQIQLTKDTEISLDGDRWRRVLLEAATSTDTSQTDAGATNEAPINSLWVAVIEANGESLSVSIRLDRRALCLATMLNQWRCPTTNLYLAGSPQEGAPFNGQLHDVRLNHLRLSPWNYDTNGHLDYQHSQYLAPPSVGCRLGGPQAEFVPGEEIGTTY